MKIIKKVYASYIKWHDRRFCDYCLCSIGDIILQRDVPSNNQLLLTSRLMDVESYLEDGDSTFNNQNKISYKAYGGAHKEALGNRHFMDLISSYQTNGYRDDSFITCDNTFSLMDGNHRMGIHLYKGIDTVNVRMVHRKVQFEYGADWYYKVGLESEFMDALYHRYYCVQKWLIETGNTFCAIIHAQNPNSVPKDMSPVSDLQKLTTPLHISTLEDAGVTVFQFSLIAPGYKVEKGQLISSRAEEVYKIMNKRFGNSIRIEVSKSCYEGKKLWDYYHSSLKNEKDGTT